MKLRTIAMLLAAGAVVACASAGYLSVVPGVNAIGQMQVTVGDGWNQAPASLTPSARSSSRTYTRDGLLLDRLIMIPGVNDGESILVSRDKSAAMPVFRADMLANELQELVESSILKLFGEGAATVSTANLRPHGFAGISGVLFDIDAAVTESPDYRGLVGAFIADQQLYVIMYLAADPYYYDKHLATATEVINSIAMRIPTIKMSG